MNKGKALDEIPKPFFEREKNEYEEKSTDDISGPECRAVLLYVPDTKETCREADV